ncbi:uncharacterized protein JN550_002545 [Neoarthrinium moseri]|uniref:uncharacterized protein n=1 Tax=Neoarthrinium moseri TaxID=1658444 RepID=UPI001FDCB875|nr:uncharacterized protein JN550_002545 [Neoarthrinium moseri]KAI1875116.1 hypothetical protein JN550_002545 [Neoarthrinium moseri]
MLFLALVSALLVVVQSHVVITYPGWRGNNLISNGSGDGASGLGVDYTGSGLVYPYGMQWIYPCGGLPIASNRTNWPVNGGAVSLQPGWFTGHRNALIYINIGFGDVPSNYSSPLWPRFEIEGPSNNPYPGTICLPQVPVPSGYDIKPGDRATIQVVEAAVHGAAMYSCVDITFVADAKDANEVNETNCVNSTTIRFLESTLSTPTTQSNLTCPAASLTQSTVATVTASGGDALFVSSSVLVTTFMIIASVLC